MVGGSISVSRFGRMGGGGERGCVQICGGSKSAVTPGRRIESFELEQLSKEILEYEAIMTTIWKKNITVIGMF